MKDNCLYFDITQKERDSAIRYLLGAIIKCRKEGNQPSNAYVYDEDVNVYLAHLLFAVSLPEYHEMAEPYLSKESSEVLRSVDESDDDTIRYFIFKVNADHLLIHTAIFNDLLGRNRSKFFRSSREHYRELAKLYYDQAASYHKRIYRKNTAVGDVLGKLSHYYELYQGLLLTVRREYFNFVNSFKDQAFKYFIREIHHYEREAKRRIKMDQFLDLYARWLETKDQEVENTIYQVISELKSLDPEFHFEFPKYMDRARGGPDERKCA